MNIDYGLLGGRIARLRKERGFTQARLSERADLSNNYLSNIENSRSIPSLETLVKLCGALGVTPNDILLGTNTSEEDYLNDDLSALFAQCTPREKRYIAGFINILLSERE
jgi:transcriptional regulator with XRE-family HTH domain